MAPFVQTTHTDAMVLVHDVTFPFCCCGHRQRPRFGAVQVEMMNVIPAGKWGWKSQLICDSFFCRRCTMTRAEVPVAPCTAGHRGLPHP